MGPQPGGLSRRARDRRGAVVRVMVAVDPYDSGQFGWFGIAGVDDRNRSPRMQAGPAIRSSIPRSSAIRPGNCSILPNCRRRRERASCNWSLPGADPRGHLAILDFFRRHHPRIGALVFAIDDPWCSHAPANLPANSFPFWLYGTSSSRLCRATVHLERDRPFVSADHDRLGFAPAHLSPMASGAMRKSGRRVRSIRLQSRSRMRRPSRGTVSDVFPFKAMLDQAARKCRRMCRLF